MYMKLSQYELATLLAERDEKEIPFQQFYPYDNSARDPWRFIPPYYPTVTITNPIGAHGGGGGLRVGDLVN